MLKEMSDTGHCSTHHLLKIAVTLLAPLIIGFITRLPSDSC